MIPNSVDGYAAAIVVLLTLERRRRCLHKKFKQKNNLYLSKTRDAAQIAHTRKGGIHA